MSDRQGEPGAEQAESEAAPKRPGRAALLRRLVVFQLKLALDGLRDVVLSPASLIAVLWGIVFHGSEPDRPFRRVLRLGRESDVWIDLFDSHGGEHDDARGVNQVVDRVEGILREEFERGGGLEGARARLQALKRRPPDQS